MAPLDPLVHLRDEVVPQVVEPEVVVRAVRDVGRVGLAPRARAQVDEPLVGRGVPGLEAVGLLAHHDPHRDAQEVEDRAHPLGVAAGQVVVHGHDVNAPPGEAVERRGERRYEGLAFARLHLGDLALVEDDSAHHLDVEMAHPERPAHGFARRREHLRQDVVERRLELLGLLLQALGLEVAATGRVVLVELVRAPAEAFLELRQPGPDLVHSGPDLGVGLLPELRLQRVRGVDERLEAPDLAVVGIDETGEEAKHHGTVSIGVGSRAGPRSPASRLERATRRQATRPTSRTRSHTRP